MSKVTRPFEGVIPNLERLYQESESEFTRNRLKGFMSPQFCDACKGQRLKPEILAVTIGGADTDRKLKMRRVEAGEHSRAFDHGSVRAFDRGGG